MRDRQLAADLAAVRSNLARPVPIVAGLVAVAFLVAANTWWTRLAWLSGCPIIGWVYGFVAPVLLQREEHNRQDPRSWRYRLSSRWRLVRGR